MLAFPPCKINLGLSIIGRRADGYHDIETCFYPVPWTDILEIVVSDKFDFTLSGRPVPGGVADNLCVRAYELIAKDFDIGPVKMHLHKCIPMGAGLGGGSSDAAHTLRLLSEVFNLNLRDDTLRRYASALGSDCAFFVSGKPARGMGRGDQLTEVDVTLGDKFMVIVAPDIHISTAAAYADVVPGPPTAPCARVVSGMPVHEWKDHLKNDFETPLFRKHPEIARIKKVLYDAGARYAAMSGSGAAVFGIFDQSVPLPDELQQYYSWHGVPAV